MRKTLYESHFWVCLAFYEVAQGGLRGGDTQTLLITRLRPKGLKVVPEPKVYADFKNPFLDCRKWGDLGKKNCFSELTVYYFMRKLKNYFDGHTWAC